LWFKVQYRYYMRVIVLLLLTTLVFHFQAQSQYYDESTSMVLSLEAANPIGSYSTLQSTGVAGSVKFRFPAGAQSDFFLTGTAAAFKGGKLVYPNTKYRTPTSKVATALVGYRAYLSPLWNPNTFYFQIDGGLTAVTSKLIGPTLIPSLGYLIGDKIDIFLKYHNTFSNNNSLHVSYIGLGVGYGINFR